MRVHRAGLRLLAGAVALTALVAPPPASADSVTDWNLNATDVLIRDAGQGAASIYHLAMVQGAVYDAVNAIDGRRYEPYLSAPRARRWYSKDAAVAAAAYRVLVASQPGLVRPDQQAQLEATLTPRYQAALAAIPEGRAKAGGIATGIAAADAMIAGRRLDGRFQPLPFTVGMLPGQWRPTPPNFVNDPYAWLRAVRPFLIADATQFGSEPPLRLTGRRYAREFNDVKTLGSIGSTARSQAQTDAATYWGSANATGTWSAIYRAIALQQGGSEIDHARLFAMLYTASADALITVWADKEKWDFWRPITAIREAASDGNPATDPDPTWTPLITNPPYPDHPSGLSALGGASVAMLQQFYGTDRVAFTVANAVGQTRSFASFSAAIDDIVDARVWGGIHFRFADEQGARVGERVARWGGKRYFRGRRHLPCRMGGA